MGIKFQQRVLIVLAKVNKVLNKLGSNAAYAIKN